MKEKLSQQISKLRDEQKCQISTSNQNKESIEDYHLIYEDKMARFIEIIQNEYDDINFEISKSSKTKQHSDDIPILQRLQDGTDSEETDSEETVSEGPAPPTLEHIAGDNNGLTKKIRKPKKRQVILAENKEKYDAEQMKEMTAICRRIGMKEDPNIGSKLYDFGSHLDVYRNLDWLFKTYDIRAFGVFVDKQKQSWCRDIKYALRAKGGIVPLSTMKMNISKRFEELKPLYRSQEQCNESANGRNMNGIRRKRFRVDGNTDNMAMMRSDGLNRKRRKIGNK